MGYYLDVIELLGILDITDLSIGETLLGIGDWGVTLAGCIGVGDCYYDQPHPDLPNMVVIGQDVLVTSVDVGLPIIMLGTTGPVGQIATDGITTSFSLMYDGFRIWGGTPTHINIGIGAEIYYFPTIHIEPINYIMIYQ